MAYGLTIPRSVRGGTKRKKAAVRTAKRRPKGAEIKRTGYLIHGIRRIQTPAPAIM